MSRNLALKWFIGQEAIPFGSNEDGRTTTIPVHPGKELPRGLIRKILRDVELSVEDYIKMK